MKKITSILARVVVILIVFITTAIFVDKFQNKGYKDKAIEMGESTLPLAYVLYDGNYINPMHGYTSDVDTSLLRESITPIDENKQVEVVVHDVKECAKDYKYEIRSIAGDSLIEDGVPEIECDDAGNTHLFITIRMDVKEDMEYMLVVKLANEKLSAKYYTRIVVNSDYHANDLMTFVDKFHDATFDFAAYEEGSIIESYQKIYGRSAFEDVSKFGLGHVNLGSTYNDITWSGLKPTIITSVMPRIKEIDTNYAVIELDYKAETLTSEDKSSIYSVKEFYQVSYNEGNILLMNFDRYVDEYFNKADIDALNNIYEIGIVSDDDVDYKFSGDNKKISFVRNGQLWLYDYKKNQISLVYSFWMDDYENATNTFDNYDINIISMTDEGDLTFAVYGYMNRGEHEGQLGVGLYEFSYANLELNELVFAEHNVPYEAMKEALSKLTYYDGSKFYFTLGNKVNVIDIAEKQLSYLVDGVSANAIYASKNMEVVASCVSDTQHDNDKINLYNLSTGEYYEIKARSGKCLICYGFKDSDLIYGECDKQDLELTKDKKSFAKTRITYDYEDKIPAERIYIMNSSAEIIKEYSRDGYYVAQVDIETDLLYLTRCIKNDAGFKADTDDFITFKNDDEKPVVGTELRISDTGTTKLYFTMADGIYLAYTPRLNAIKNTTSDDNKNMVISVANEKANYMVYDNLGLSRIFEQAGDSINYAMDVSGIVVSKNGEVIYRKSEGQEYNTIASTIFHHSSGNVTDSLKDCLYMTLVHEGAKVDFEEMGNYSNVVDVLNEFGPFEGLDISGLSLDMVLKYVSDGVPVIARISDGRYVLVVSYNSTDVRYYDPVQDEEIVKSRKEFTNLMEQGNNELYTYAKQ